MLVDVFLKILQFLKGIYFTVLIVMSFSAMLGLLVSQIHAGANRGGGIKGFHPRSQKFGVVQ